MNYIDLFAGAGGLSEGFHREGYEAVAHIEMDANACLTLKTRVAYHYLYKNDLKDEYVKYLKGEISRDDLYALVPNEYLDSVINDEISVDTIESIFEKIDSRIGAGLDLIIGGPPCQAYSTAASHIEEKNKKLIYLYELYGEFLKRYEPKMFIFENVPGLRTADGGKYYEGLKKCFSDIGYEFDDKTLNASDFNVPQNRKRVIIIGWKKELNIGYPEFEPKKPDVTINKLFSDLPKLGHGESINVGSYSKKGTSFVNDYIRNGIDVITHHVTRAHNQRDLEIYKMAKEKWAEGVRLRNSDIPEEMRTQKNITSFLDRFKVVDGEGYSHTMIAHIAKDGHYYIHPDEEQLRSLSVREAARIQSFPDDYFFEGPRTSAFRQIGNAVPPLMGQELAKVINKKLEGLNGE